MIEPIHIEEPHIYLNVPYEEKERAKRLGCKWDPYYRKWYTFTERNLDLPQLVKYMYPKDRERLGFKDDISNLIRKLQK